MDLRNRVLAAVDDGASCRAAAARFGVAPTTAVRWHAQRRITGTYAPRPQGGDTRSRRIERHRERVLARWETKKDVTLDELRVELVRTGLTVSHATLRHGILRTKTAHAVEQDRPDILKERHEWLEGQLDLEPERLVFIDET